MPDSPDYSALKLLLENRLSVISDTQLRDKNPTEQLAQLQQISQGITDWQANTKRIPQQLNHYLIQSSLSKALEFVKEL